LRRCISISGFLPLQFKQVDGVVIIDDRREAGAIAAWAGNGTLQHAKRCRQAAVGRGRESILLPSEAAHEAGQS
jgi:hypothetical protein